MCAWIGVAKLLFSNQAPDSFLRRLGRWQMYIAFSFLVKRLGKMEKGIGVPWQ